jgi:tetratricopeptide (TPR) repeat protein
MQNFSWSRTMSKTKLTGFCNKCGYGDVCLGGCPNTRLTFEQDIYSENKFCLYNMAIQKAKAKIDKITDTKRLLELGKRLVERKEFQIAELIFAKAIKLDNTDIELLKHYGFICFMLGNYEDAKRANEQALKLDSDCVYSNKGMGVTLAKLGQVDEGLEYLRKAAKMTDAGNMYPYYDLALTLIEHNRNDEARSVIKEAKDKTPEFSSMEEILLSIMENMKSAS